MVKGELLSAAEAAAYGAKLCCVESVPYFPMLHTNRLAEKLSSLSDCLTELETQSFYCNIRHSEPARFFNCS